MSKKTIFKTLAMAMLMPAMLLTTACSSDDAVIDNNNDKPNKNGYTYQVTINVTRDDATRAHYNGDTKKLEFSTGDKLFIKGKEVVAGGGKFAGTLDYVSEGTFSGTITTEHEWENTIIALFNDAAFEGTGELNATLLPAGYSEIGFLTISGSGYSASLADPNYSKAVATDKATAVEQFSLEQAGKTNYTTGGTFALSPKNAIVSFTLNNLAANASFIPKFYDTNFHNIGDKQIIANSSGTATFAMGVDGSLGMQEWRLADGMTSQVFSVITIGTHSLVAGKIYNISRNVTPAPSVPEGAINGKFSVSATKQVYFSKGNLQATYNGSDWSWAFAEHQWSYVGNAAANNAITGNKTVSANGIVDLFGWSTSTTYLGIHNSRDNGYYSGDFVDWGSHEDVTAGIGEGWCTLPKDEWLYLFYTRSDAADKYGYATVNGVHGIIFLPDAFVDPNKNNGSDAFVGSSTNGWNANLYTADSWALMEKNGAVFLPAAGYRDEADVYDGDDGYYWSSSANSDDEEEAHYVYFDSDDFDLHVDNSTSRYCGHSVRLVRPVQ